MIVKALAPTLKLIVLTVVGAESETPMMFDVKKVAVSVPEFGMLPPTQFVVVFQSPVPGAAFHVSLPAKTGAVAPSSSAAMEPASGFKAQRSGEGVVFFI